MELVEREITPGQLSQLARAVAATKAQFAAAREIARDEMQINPNAITDDTLLEIVQILALNMQSVALRPS